MKDFQIRKILRKTELSQFLNDGVSKVVEEMKIPVAQARIDMAVINGAFHGYEIKSASDTLQRLPNQLIAYSYIFDYLTIITEKKYHQKIIDAVPSWVGVAVCSNKVKEKKFVMIQEAKPNINKNKFYIAKLLWHDELVEVLTEQEIAFKKKSRNWILCEILSDNLQLDKLSEIVREKLKKRNNWKLKDTM